MPIKYKVVSKRPASALSEKPVRYYPAITDRKTADTRKICQEISGMSSFTTGDVRGIIECFVQVIPKFLLDGYSIKLDGLGTFSVHATSKGQDSPEKVTKRDITELRVAFLPDKEMKSKLKSKLNIQKK